ncbi:MAG TPA: glycosyltransferase family 2 protein [Thermoanaerobaculia bacterium]|nr:glycosyltransferase family 2 protein [Thermoanaerobaculia bacterium]
MSFALVVFVLSFGACVYVYFGYPALLLVISRVAPRPVRRAPVQPMMTLLIPVYNEEEHVAAKIANSLALEWAPDRLEVLVVSDGSTDRTEELVEALADQRIRLLRRPRQGKAAALNEGAREARGEILVLTDANALLAKDCLLRLAEPFADPEVGGVCGNKKYRAGTGADATELGENLYWRYDKWQKELESRIGSIFAADGTLYALRRELYVPIADPAQADDIAISTRVVLQGHRLLYEPGAVAWEEPPAEGRDELRRKVRVTNHSVRALFGLGRALWTSGFYSVELLSHKLLRHLAPFFLLALLLSNIALALEGPLFQLVLALHLAFYGLAFVGYALRDRRAGRSRLLSIPYYFSLVNLAALLGVLSILRGERRERWTPRRGLDP